MSSLASLLVRDQALPVERVQQLIQEQVVRGGNLDTVLLELGGLSENEVNAYCAAVWGLLPGTREEVMAAPLSTTRLLPREFAVRHRVIPIARTDDTVVLAVDRPLTEASLREIWMELGVDPAQRIVCTLRIEVGLAQHYDIHLTSRMRALKERLDRQAPGPVPFVAPYDGVATRSSLPVEKSEPAYRSAFRATPPPDVIAHNDASPWTTAPTAPPPPPSEIAALSSRSASSPSSAPTKKTSVPHGTFRQSSPGLRAPQPPKGFEPGFLDATRYSMPPREAEVLGRPQRRLQGLTKASGPRSGGAGAPGKAAEWTTLHPEKADGSRSGAPSTAAGWSSLHPEPVSEIKGGFTSRWQSRSAPSGSPQDEDRSGVSPEASSRRANVRASAPPSASLKPRKAGRSSLPPESELSLPSVILDVDDGVERLIAGLRQASPEDELPILPLLAAGEGALPALAREFPGGLWFDRRQPHSSLPEGRNVSPIARAFVAFGEMAVPYLAPLVEHNDADKRYYACLLAAEFIHPELVRPVGKRIFDSDLDVRSVAFRALSVLSVCSEEFAQLVKMLRSTARDPQNSERQVVAVEALGRLRDVGSFEFLLSLLNVANEELVRAAHASLVRLSGQDFGKSTKKWGNWYQKNRSKHRVQWLIDALMHSDPRLRRRASDELKHLTQEYFGYHPTLPRRDRDRARNKYLSWWQQVGFRMFSEEDPALAGQPEDE
jgi:hypothetical protein